MQKLHPQLDSDLVFATEAIDTLNEKALQLLNVDVRQSLEISKTALVQSSSPQRAQDYLKGKVQALLVMGASSYRLNNNEEAIRYSEEAIEISEGLQDFRSLTFGLNTIGATCINLGEYDRALEVHLQSLRIRENIQDEVGAATSLMNIGNVYFLLGEFAHSLEYYYKSLELRERIADLTGIGTSLTNIANVYASMNDHEQALEYLLRSAEIKERTDNKQGLGQTLVDIANEYLGRQMNSLAMDYALKSYELSKDIGNKVAQAAALHTMAAIEEADGSLERALNTYRRSYELRRSIEHHKGEIESLVAMGRLLCRVGDAEESDGVLSRAHALAEHIGSRPLLFEACGALAHSFELRSMHKDALYFYKRFHDIKEELFNEESAQKTRNLQTLHKVEQARKEAEIYRLRTVELSAANQEILRQQQVLSCQSQELHEQNDELQQLVREKNELLAIVAHDLKNPLSGIVISTSNVQRNLQRMSGEDAQAQLQIIERTAKRMKDIIHNLLDLHALETKGMNLSIESLNLCDSIQQVVENFHPRAAEKEIALRVDVEQLSMIVNADANALQQVLENLLSNAIKFSPPSSEIIVRCLRSVYGIRLEICDEGPGIYDEDRSKLFTKFAKMKNRPTAGEESTGLGLNIVMQLCQAMSISVDQFNQQPCGSCFHLLFAEV